MDAKQSKLMNKLKKNAKGAWERSRSKEASVGGFQTLPAGIVGGIAQLDSWKFDETKNGAPYLMLMGTVQEPEEVRGRKASHMHMLEENEWNSMEDRLDRVSSDLQLLGGETEGTSLEEMIGVAAQLADDIQPFYTFNTEGWESKDGKKSGVNTYIQGLAEDYEGPGEHTTVEDDGEESSVPFDGDEASMDEAEADLQELAEQADAEGADTCPAISEAAEPHGIDPNEYATWIEVVQAIEEAEAASEPNPDGTTDDGEGDDGGEEATGDDDDWIPEVGETWRYAVNGKATPKDCVVTTVNKSQRTCTLKRDEDEKVFKGVSWDKLVGEE